MTSKPRFHFFPAIRSSVKVDTDLMAEDSVEITSALFSFASHDPLAAGTRVFTAPQWLGHFLNDHNGGNKWVARWSLLGETSLVRSNRC
jgi:hypothetical protein